MIARVAVVCLIIFQFGFLESAVLSIAAKKCKEYAKVYEGTCPPRTIAGERLAKPGEFPYMAALKYLNAHGESLYSCTAVLVSEDYLLAPAYCILSSIGAPVSARLGYFNALDDDLGPHGQEIKVIQLKPHPAYSKQNATNVLALIRLEKKVEMNQFVHPICLDEEGFASGEVMASGWNFVGKPINDAEEKYKGQLLKSMYSSFDREECRKFYEKTTYKITDEQFCVGLRNHKCTMEPNGIVLNPSRDVACMDTLIGLDNYGPARCVLDVNPDVYTRIWPYVRWIESVVWE